MEKYIKALLSVLKESKGNAILGSIVSFVVFFAVIILIVLLFIFIIKGLPFLIKLTGEGIYRASKESKKTGYSPKKYKHIDKPLKPLSEEKHTQDS